MGLLELRQYLLDPHVDLPGRTRHSTRPLFKNFTVCPHCEKKGRTSVVKPLNQSGVVISRSDGESFHVFLGDRPIAFPSERRSRKTTSIAAGFLYVSERNGIENAFTNTVVVLLRTSLRGARLLSRLELVADRLAKLLAKMGQLETTYEFSGNKLHAGF
jgi:hypothetical protein